MITNLKEFIAASQTFSMPEEKIEAAEKGRMAFISKFPLSSIQFLTLDAYCVGTSEDSFCYWLEFKNILFGIGGGNASKFGIYKSKDGNYYQDSGPKKVPLKGKVLDTTFSKIKQDILQGLRFVELNQIEKIPSIGTTVWNMVMLKIFTIYYPDKFLTIGDPIVIIECAKKIGITDVELKAKNSILLNYLCRKKLNETKEFSGWDYAKIGTLVWETFKKNETGKTVLKPSNDEHIKMILKMDNTSYYRELRKFLEQAKTSELGTTDYVNNFQGLLVKVSFGKGNKARVPWIAFLDQFDTVQEGIYPVYLYYKEKELLILAYGVSEANKPNRSWNGSSKKTILEYFTENSLGNPDRYGSSFVFKTYDIRKTLNEEEVNSDLNELIAIYKSTQQKSKVLPQEFQQKMFVEAISNAGIFLSEKLSLRFISSLLAKPFVILTGLSGSGKTKLAQAFAMWICEDENQYCILPVGADWTNREPLLGFPNALEENNYVRPDNGVLDLIIEANKNQHRPYFLILDEMNLSHVERYFADFLSVMESKNKIALHSGDGDWNNVPSEIGFPKNLFIIGTVNIDETTYMFSPKVLDRASVIEFRVTAEEMEHYLGSNAEINLKDLEGLGKDMAESFVEIAKDISLEANNAEELNKTLMSFFAELKKTGAEFGYRSATEIIRFAEVANKLNADWSSTEITDAAIMQRLLPKVHGSRRKLEPVLKTLGSLCLQSGEKMEDFISKSEIDFADITKIKFPVSLEKILRMYQSLISNGFTSYAEA